MSRVGKCERKDGGSGSREGDQRRSFVFVSQSILSYLWSSKRCNLPYFTKLVQFNGGGGGGEENTDYDDHDYASSSLSPGWREGGRERADSFNIQWTHLPSLLPCFLLYKFTAKADEDAASPIRTQIEYMVACPRKAARSKVGLGRGLLTLATEIRIDDAGEEKGGREGGRVRSVSSFPRPNWEVFFALCDIAITLACYDVPSPPVYSASLSSRMTRALTYLTYFRNRRPGSE